MTASLRASAGLLRALGDELEAVSPQAAAEWWRAEALRLSPEDLARVFARMPLEDQARVLASQAAILEHANDSAAANVELAEKIGARVGMLLGLAQAIGVPMFGIPGILKAILGAADLVESGQVEAGVSEIRRIAGELLGLPDAA